MKKFNLYWITQSFSIFGNQLTTFALPIWLFQTYGNAKSIGIMAALTTIARIIAGPVSGTAIDQGSKRKIITVCEIAQFLIMLLFIAVVDKRPGIYAIGMILMFSTIFETIRFPAIMATVPLLVPKSDIYKANSYFSLTDSFSTLFAPILGGIFLTYYGFKNLLWLDALTFLISAAFIFCLIISKEDNQLPIWTFKFSHFNGRHIFASIKSNLKMIKNIPGVVELLIATSITNFFLMGTMILFSPMLISEKFSVKNISLAFSLAGGFQLLVTFALSKIKFKRPVQFIGTGIMVIGIFGFLAIALGKNNLIMSILGLVVIYSIIPILNAVNRSLFQMKIPENLHGRFFSVRRSISQSTTPLAMLIFSFSVDFFNKKMFFSGYRMIYFIAFVVVISVGVMVRFSKRYAAIPLGNEI